LLAATATKWPATAHLPRELARAGFEVTVLAPRDALVAKSRYVSAIAPLPHGATPLHWAHLLVATIAAKSPRLVIPCDDTAVHLMMAFVEAPPANLDVTALVAVSGLLRESLGAPRHYRASVDKSLLPDAAAVLGVRVPQHAVVADPAGARAFARSYGYPVVIKRAFGTAGHAVRVVRDDSGLEPAVHELLSTRSQMLWNSAALSIQSWVPGRGLLVALAAWHGVVHAGMTRDVLVRSPEIGPSTVVRCRNTPEARRFAELLVSGLGISGFVGVEFIEHADTGDAYLLEINRRVTNGIPLGGFVGVDCCGALKAALEGSAFTGRRDLPEGEEHLIAEFPQEWLRDPGSDYLRTARSNVPWDDPELLQAMLALRDTSSM